MFRLSRDVFRWWELNSKSWVVAVMVLAGATIARADLAVPVHNSLPGATAKLYLDFDGDVTADWLNYHPNTTLAYTLDSDPTSFSAIELSSIDEIWARVAEKYSPFSINVTTIDPGNLNDHETLKAVIGGDGAWTGVSAGGIGAVGGFAKASAPNTVFIFSQHIAAGAAAPVAETVAHEAGHGLNLNHQSTFEPSEEYNQGDGLKAPIMGESRLSVRGLWWNGLNNYGFMQDDMTTLAATGGPVRNNFGYRPDDHTTLAGDPLVADGFSLSGGGVIEQLSDHDWFSFSTSGGVIDLDANVAPFGAMLDLSLNLYDESDELIASRATYNLGESITQTLLAGTYKIEVLSAGNYGDVGQYNLSASVTPVPEADCAIILLAALFPLSRYAGRGRG